MKKFFTVIVAAFVAVAAHAQFYAGGSLSFHSGDNSRIYVAPEAGYNFNDNFAAGAVVSLDHSKDIATILSLSPYIRWTFADWAPVKFFLDGGLMFDSVSLDEKTWGESKTYSAIEVGVKPGIAVPLNESLQLVAHLGFVGVCAADDNLQRLYGYDDGVVAYLGSKDLSIGIFYCF
ncbi:MAG: hypothetical protein J5771_00130 [Bacteroidales bacterium]|nr:hypothetical protein [Bacteroidales bacterium]